MTIEFLLDANISPGTCTLLIDELKLKAIHLASLKLMHLSDAEIVQVATEGKRVIITFDLDFGQMFRHTGAPRCGVVILRLSDQSVGSANSALRRFFESLNELDSLRNALAIVDDRRVRLIR